MHSPANIEVERHDGDLASLEGVWTALTDAMHPGAPFRSAAWLTPWWKHLSPDGEPYVLVARRGGEIVGILPLYSQPGVLGGRRLKFLADGVVGSDYLGVVARPYEAHAVAWACVEYLSERNEDELELDGLVPDDPLTEALHCVHGPRAVFEPRYRCPHVLVSGSFADYLEARPDGLGAQWRRRKRWLE